MLRSMAVAEGLLTKDDEGRVAGLNPKADDADAAKRMAVVVLNFIWIY